MSTPTLRSPGIRIFALAALAILLMVPLLQVRGLIHERAQRSREAEAGIAAPWGQAQQLGGAYVTAEVPTRVVVGDKTLLQNHTHVLLADNLHIDANLQTETRHRGMFSVPVYTATLRIKALFLASDMAALRARSDPESPLRVRMALSDAKGVRAITSWRINGEALRPSAGGSGLAQLQSLAVEIPTAMLGQDLSVEIEATVAGTRNLQFLPFSRDTRVKVQGAWPHPGFVGAYLPAERTIGAASFDARWQVLEFNRRYAQHFAESTLDVQALSESAFGVDLFQPANVYQQNERSGKYGLLIIALVFSALFLFEILGGLVLHPVQYLLVGAVLALFYLLLLALSEHLGFGRAYAIAALVAVVLTGGYARAVLGSSARALSMAGLQAGAYALFFVLVANEDFALLLGATALTVVLALILFLTRRTNWYTLGR